MSEGELKKRIRKMLQYYEVHQVHVEEILDEAAKEFPLNYKELGFPKTPFDDESDNEIGKWFLKYFGEQK